MGGRAHGRGRIARISTPTASFYRSLPTRPCRSRSSWSRSSHGDFIAACADLRAARRCNVGPERRTPNLSGHDEPALRDRLTDAQLMGTHVPLTSLYDELGHEERDPQGLVGQLPRMVPDEDELRAIDLVRELARRRDSAAVCATHGAVPAGRATAPWRLRARGEREGGRWQRGEEGGRGEGGGGGGGGGGGVAEPARPARRGIPGAHGPAPLEPLALARRPRARHGLDPRRPRGHHRRRDRRRLHEKERSASAPSQLGLAGTVYIVGAAIGALFFGYLTDRLGRKSSSWSRSASTWSRRCDRLHRSFASFCGLPVLHRPRHRRRVRGDQLGHRRADPRARARLGRPRDQRLFWLGAAFGAALSRRPARHDLFASTSAGGWPSASAPCSALGIMLVRRNVPESPRWLMIHGRDEEAEQFVGEIEERVKAATGGRELDEPERRDRDRAAQEPPGSSRSGARCSRTTRDARSSASR